jgi:hypothetical protein
MRENLDLNWIENLASEKVNSSLLVIADLKRRHWPFI